MVFICLFSMASSKFGNIVYVICPVFGNAMKFGMIYFYICLFSMASSEFGNIIYLICPIFGKAIKIGMIFFYICLFSRTSWLCPYNCVKEKSHSHPHDTIILDQQNFVGGNENDSTQFYLKLRRTKRTNY